MPSIETENLNLTDNSCTLKDKERYCEITVDVAKTIESWRLSLYSFEWIDSEGVIRPTSELNEKNQARHKEIEGALNKGDTLEKPVLGLGLQDNVEIGSGKALFLTLASMGVNSLPVHILKSQESDFKDYLA